MVTFTILSSLFISIVLHLHTNLATFFMGTAGKNSMGLEGILWVCIMGGEIT